MLYQHRLSFVRLTLPNCRNILVMLSFLMLITSSNGFCQLPSGSHFFTRGQTFKELKDVIDRKKIIEGKFKSLVIRASSLERQIYSSQKKTPFATESEFEKVLEDQYQKISNVLGSPNSSLVKLMNSTPAIKSHLVTDSKNTLIDEVCLGKVTENIDMLVNHLNTVTSKVDGAGIFQNEIGKLQRLFSDLHNNASTLAKRELQLSSLIESKVQSMIFSSEAVPFGPSIDKLAKDRFKVSRTDTTHLQTNHQLAKLMLERFQSLIPTSVNKIDDFGSSLSIEFKKAIQINRAGSPQLANIPFRRKLEGFTTSSLLSQSIRNSHHTNGKRLSFGFTSASYGNTMMPTVIELSPRVSYKILKPVVVGIAPTIRLESKIQTSQFTVAVGGYALTSFVEGRLPSLVSNKPGSIFLSGNVDFNNIYSLNNRLGSFSPNSDRRTWYPSGLIGLTKKVITPKKVLRVELLYRISNNFSNAYLSPCIFRFGWEK